MNYSNRTCYTLELIPISSCESYANYLCVTLGAGVLYGYDAVGSKGEVSYGCQVIMALMGWCCKPNGCAEN